MDAPRIAKRMAGLKRMIEDCLDKRTTVKINLRSNALLHIVATCFYNDDIVLRGLEQRLVRQDGGNCSHGQFHKRMDITRKNLKQNFGMINDLVVQVDPNEGAVGTIRWISGACSSVVGVPASVALGLSINIILPESVSRFHNNKIENFMKSGRAINQFSKNEVVIVNVAKQGRRIDTWVKSFFDVTTSTFSLNTYVREVYTFNMFLIINALGFIEVVGKNCCKLLKPYLENFPTQKPSVFIFSPQLLHFFFERSAQFRAQFDPETRTKPNSNHNLEERHMIKIIKEDWVIGGNMAHPSRELVETLTSGPPSPTSISFQPTSTN